jgi:hypothetical protein
MKFAVDLFIPIFLVIRLNFRTFMPYDVTALHLSVTFPRIKSTLDTVRDSSSLPLRAMLQFPILHPGAPNVMAVPDDSRLVLVSSQCHLVSLFLLTSYRASVRIQL